MAVRKYQYETSPRKLEPQQGNRKKKKQNSLKLVEKQRHNITLTKEEKAKQRKVLMGVVIVFAMLLTVSYRNSQINESFSSIKSMEINLALMEKENEQARVNIENGLNLNTIEKQAKEVLGMQKIMTSQTKYVSLPKKDYISPATAEFVVAEESIFKKIVDIVGNMF